VRRLINTKERILAGIRNGDERVLKYLYDKHYSMIRSLVLQNSGSEDDVQDVLQDGIIIFYEKALDSKFKLTSEVNSYIYSVCRNQWLKTLRARFKKSNIEDVFVQASDYEEEKSRHKNIIRSKKYEFKLAVITFFLDFIRHRPYQIMIINIKSK